MERGIQRALARIPGETGPRAARGVDIRGVRQVRGGANEPPQQDDSAHGRGATGECMLEPDWEPALHTAATWPDHRVTSGGRDRFVTGPRPWYGALALAACGVS